MPGALWFTDDEEACRLLAQDPFALLVGFALDQQVTVQQAFLGPLRLKERLGTLEPRAVAEADLEPLFRQKPAIHRFPGSMAQRVRELAAVVADEYGSDASRGAVLAKRLGIAVAEELVPSHPTLGDVGSPQALAAYQAAKKAHKTEWLRSRSAR